MPSNMREEMEIHREHWENTLLGWEFWDKAFEWCAQARAKEFAERKEG